MEIKTENVNKAFIIKPYGEIDLNTSPQLRKILQETLKNNKLPILIDLENVRYMDSSGLATLVEIFQQTIKQKRKFSIFSLTDTVKNVFSITRLDEIFSIHPTRTKALEELVD